MQHVKQAKERGGTANGDQLRGKFEGNPVRHVTYMNQRQR